jgi:hypothetical protein
MNTLQPELLDVSEELALAAAEYAKLVVNQSRRDNIARAFIEGARFASAKRDSNHGAICLCPATSEYDPPCPRHGNLGIGVRGAS